MIGDGADAEMNAEQFEALRAAAAEGVDFDGLYVRYGDYDYDRDAGYTFGTPEGESTGLSESAFHAAAERRADYVTNWYFWTHAVDRADADGGGEGDGGADEADDGDGTPRGSPSAVGDRPGHRRRFLRWLERADERSVPARYEALSTGTGTTREWGQLRVTAGLARNGGRRYEVRHVADAGVPAADLDRHDDPAAAHRLSTYDSRGRYRPLKTAPTLRRGWTFSDLSAREAIETVEAFYPATVENWSLERAGALDVTHWDEAATRQTGIYDVIDELPDEAVNWVAESCCVDSQCLKRRQWDLDAETPLDPPRGDGAFPCREPCSLVVAASRKWTTLEREESRTYEFELTPSEKEQVEEIIDAVAEGRIDEIREADVDEGANRYRARFLRAKRLDEDGNLSGTPTDPDATAEGASADAESADSDTGDDTSDGNGDS